MTSTAESLASALADRYIIERKLGQGGMATVYLAQDLKHDRQVAIKVLKPELAAMLGAERFVIEIKTTAALQHPHILPLFDSGSADGFLFYVMPFIEGETLRTKLDRETQLDIDESVRITREVADALDYAHRHGVIHRDIKPENILLHDGRPMVADFGIALALSAAAGGRMTETGMSLGTPHYMSPEQATAAKEITGRSDIYSLGSVLYEMLTGNPPHVGLLSAADHHEDHRRRRATGDEVLRKAVPAERLRRSGQVIGEAAGRSVRECEGVWRGARQSGIHDEPCGRCWWNTRVRRSVPAPLVGDGCDRCAGARGRRLGLAAPRPRSVRNGRGLPADRWVRYSLGRRDARRSRRTAAPSCSWGARRHGDALLASARRFGDPRDPRDGQRD